MNETTRRGAEEAMALLSCKTVTDTLLGMDLAVVAEWRGARSAKKRERLHMKQQVLREFRFLLVERVRRAAEAERRSGRPEGLFAAFFRTVAKPEQEKE